MTQSNNMASCCSCFSSSKKEDSDSEENRDDRVNKSAEPQQQQQEQQQQQQPQQQQQQQPQRTGQQPVQNATGQQITGALQVPGQQQQQDQQQMNMSDINPIMAVNQQQQQHTTTAANNGTAPNPNFTPQTVPKVHQQQMVSQQQMASQVPAPGANGRPLNEAIHRSHEKQKQMSDPKQQHGSDTSTPTTPQPPNDIHASLTPRYVRKRSSNDDDNDNGRVLFR